MIDWSHYKGNNDGPVWSTAEIINTSLEKWARVTPSTRAQICSISDRRGECLLDQQRNKLSEDISCTQMMFIRQLANAILKVVLWNVRYVHRKKSLISLVRSEKSSEWCITTWAQWQWLISTSLGENTDQVTPDHQSTPIGERWSLSAVQRRLWSAKVHESPSKQWYKPFADLW